MIPIERGRFAPAIAATILIMAAALSSTQAESQIQSHSQAQVQPAAPLSPPASLPPSGTSDSETPEANPARPTLTNPARIPPVGYLQFEQGVLQASGSPGLAQQFGPVQSIRLSLHPRLMLEFASQPVAVSSAPDGGPGLETDPGDLTAGVQAVFTDRGGRAPALAVAYTHRLRSGTSPDIDIGSFSQSATLLLSGDLAGFHYDTNYLVLEQADLEQTDLEQAGNSIRRAQFGQTLSVTHPIFPLRTHNNLSLTGELWHFTQPLVATTRNGLLSPRSNAVGTLWALGYTARKNLAFDAGLDRGLTSTSTAWQGFAGFTYLLPHRLWKHPIPD